MAQRDKYEPFYAIARAEYVTARGDIEVVFKALSGEVPRARLRLWEARNDWAEITRLVRNSVTDEFKKTEKHRAQQNFQMILLAKQQIVKSMVDQIDDSTKQIVKRAVSPRSLEECAKTLIELLRYEQANFSGDQQPDSPDARRAMDHFSRFIKGAADRAAATLDKAPVAPSAPSTEQEKVVVDEPKKEGDVDASQAGSEGRGVVAHTSGDTGSVQ